jgi:hypothetical protein
MPPASPIRVPVLLRLPRALPKLAKGVHDGVIPGLLAYAAGADWSGLEFLLLRDSRHTIACAEVDWHWWIADGGERISHSLDFFSRHYAVTVVPSKQTKKRADPSAGQKQRARQDMAARQSGLSEAKEPAGWLI